MRTLYIVTGAEGHLGSTVVRHLLERGAAVRCLTYGPDNGALAGLEVERVPGDLRDPESLDALFAGTAGQDVRVLHAAGLVSIAGKMDPRLYDTNVLGTKHLLEACLRHGARRFVYASSVHAIPEKPAPQVIAEPEALDLQGVAGAYAKTKARATQLVFQSGHMGLEPVVVYPSGLLGPNDFSLRGHMTQLVLEYLRGRLPAGVRGGYDFVDVRDVAAGMVAAAERGRPGEGYLLTGHYAAISQLLELLHQASGQAPVRLTAPRWLALGAVPFLEGRSRRRGEPPLYTAYSLYTLGTNARFSHEKAAAELGYRPRPLEETAAAAVAWCQKYI